MSSVLDGSMIGRVLGYVIVEALIEGLQIHIRTSAFLHPLEIATSYTEKEPAGT
jgi:hypothetical protein